MSIIHNAFGRRLAVFKITAAAAEYDLSAYLQKVQQNNTDIALAYRELRLSRETVNQARAPLLPGIGAEGNYTRNLQDMEQSTPVAAETVILTTKKIDLIVSPFLYTLLYRGIHKTFVRQKLSGIRFLCNQGQGHSGS